MNVIKQEIITNIFRKYVVYGVVMLFIVLVIGILTNFNTYFIYCVLGASLLTVVIIGYWISKIGDLLKQAKSLDVDKKHRQVNSVFIYEDGLICAMLDNLSVIKIRDIESVSYAKHVFDRIKYSDKLSIYLTLKAADKYMKIQLDDQREAQLIINYLGDNNNQIKFSNIEKNGSCNFEELFDLESDTRY